VTLADISANQGISLSYLEQLFAALPASSWCAGPGPGGATTSAAVRRDQQSPTSSARSTNGRIHALARGGRTATAGSAASRTAFGTTSASRSSRSSATSRSPIWSRGGWNGKRRASSCPARQGKGGLTGAAVPGGWRAWRPVGPPDARGGADPRRPFGFAMIRRPEG